MTSGKKWALILAAVLLAAALFGCGAGNARGGVSDVVSGCETGRNSAFDAQVEKAIEAIKTKWADVYAENGQGSKYLSIKNTRVIVIKDGAGDEFEGMLMVVEFSLYSDFYGSAPLYMDVGMFDCVAFYKNGTFEVLSRDPFALHVARTYNSDFSEIVESIEDLGGAFDRDLDI